MKITKDSRQILILDDEVAFVDLLCDVVEDIGIRPLGYSEYLKAINKFTSDYKNIDLVILDLNLNGKDGSDVVVELKKIDSTVKIFVISGYNDKNKILNLYNLGIVEYFQKPVGLDLLTDKIYMTLKN